MIKKIFLTLCLLVSFNNCTLGEILLEDINTPMEPTYRFGTTDIPEEKNDFKINVSLNPVIQKDKLEKETKNVTYADLSIKKMSLDISKSIDIDYNDMLADLSLLWQGAATKSDTIKFAIYKLSNPDKDKPDTNAVKKVLTTIAGMSSFVGAGIGNPVLASAALIGGNTLGILSQDNKALNYKYSQVTDSDMIILVRKVEDLQQKVVDLYYDYMTARQLYNMTSGIVEKCNFNYKRSQNLSTEVILITDTFYREALDVQQEARGHFFEARSRLEQLVGNDIFRQFEELVDKRDANLNK